MSHSQTFLFEFLTTHFTRTSSSQFLHKEISELKTWRTLYLVLAWLATAIAFQWRRKGNATNVGLLIPKCFLKTAAVFDAPSVALPWECCCDEMRNEEKLYTHTQRPKRGNWPQQGLVSVEADNGVKNTVMTPAPGEGGQGGWGFQRRSPEWWRTLRSGHVHAAGGDTRVC